jgi:hypothetical protein
MILADVGFHPHESSIAVDLKGIVVNLGNSSAVAQTERTRSGLDPFEGRFFCPSLIFKNGVFLSVIVNDFNFDYLVSNHLKPPSLIARRIVAIRRLGENYAIKTR